VIDLAAETGRLLDFGRAARVPGGFAWLDDAGVPDPSEPLRLLIAARMTHCYAIGHLLGRAGCAELADHGLEALAGTFADAEHGGWFSAVRDGRPVATEKAAYDHAFVLLAGASAAAAERPGAAELLTRAGDVMLERFWAEDEGANREQWDRAWRSLDGYRGANANMHAVEAFLAAGDATGDPAWHERALRVAERLIDTTARAHGWRVVEHFDSAWRPRLDYNADRPRDQFRPFGVTPGHGLEWSRLLVQLHASLADPPAWLLEAARDLFARAVEDGVEPDGGIVYTTDHDGRPVVRDRFHWVVAEAIGAAATLARVSGAEAYEGWHGRT
jgi:sulfoquinovose isomerase